VIDNEKRERKKMSLLYVKNVYFLELSIKKAKKQTRMFLF